MLNVSQLRSVMIQPRHHPAAGQHHLHAVAGAGTGGDWPGPPGRDVQEGDEGDAEEEEAAETGGHDADHHPVRPSLILSLSGDLQ